MTTLTKEELEKLVAVAQMVADMADGLDMAAQTFGQYEVYEMTKPGYEELKPWPSTEKAARDLGFNVDSPSWDEARKDWGLES